jgi:hypothetical protein
MLAIIALTAGAIFLPHMLSAWVGLNFRYRLIISGLLLAPLGFVMGMPFPTGLRSLGSLPRLDVTRDKDEEDNVVEWAWAMNAAASVLGSVLAMLIAIEFGLSATLACGTAAYLLALLFVPALHSQRA